MIKEIDDRLMKIKYWQEQVKTEIDELANSSQNSEYFMMLKGSYNAYERVIGLFDNYTHVPNAIEAGENMTC